MSEDQRKFKGVWIPAEIWLDHTISITEKVMLVEIDSLESEDRGCYKSNAEFAEFFGLSTSRVSEIISGLAEKRLIAVTLIREGKRVVERQIRMATPFGKPNTPYSEKAENLFGKGGEGYSEKAEGSNTKRNTTSKRTADDSAKHSSVDEKFEQAWQQYPKREGSNSKQAALRAWNARIREGIDPGVLIAAVKAYAVAMQAASNVGTPYVKQASTFFGPDRHFEEYSKPASGQELFDSGVEPGTWWARAGFRYQWQAINAGCTERSAHLWSNGEKGELRS